MKVLIWDLNFELKDNKGGPAGVLYNIKYYLTEKNSQERELFFLNDLYPHKFKEKSNFEKSVIKANNSILDFLSRPYRALRVILNKADVNIARKVCLDNFDFIHFHSSFDLYNAMPLLNAFKGKVVLMSHSPEPMSSEIVNRVWGAPKSLVKGVVYKILIKREVVAFKRADYLMFPTPYSREPYMRDRQMKKIIKEKDNNIIYCPTGIIDLKNTQRESCYFSKKLNIPENAFKIVYIGRHNEVKGYKELKIIGQQILKRIPNAYFIVGGTGPLLPLDDEHWIELGYTTEANSIISNADVFILPNRETYFDLVALEVLRAGTPLVMTDTGGNKYLMEKYPYASGLYVYDKNNIGECIKILIDLYDKKQKFEIEKFRYNVRKYWEDYYSIDNYVRSYKNLLQSLIA